MNFSQSLIKLEKSSEFKKFKQGHPEAYLCAGFFVLDFEGTSQQSLDFQLPNKKIATFSLNDKINFKIEEMIKKEKLSKLNKEKVKVEIEDLKGIVESELEKKSMSKTIKKIIAILQVHEGKQIWNLTCMLESFAMLRIHIDALSGEVLKSEKSSLFDFVKKV